MVNPTGGFRPAVTAKASTQAQPRTFGTPAGATPAGALAAPGGFGGNANNPVFSLATPGTAPGGAPVAAPAAAPGGAPVAAPAGAPGGPPATSNIPNKPYAQQVKDLVGNIMNANGNNFPPNDQTLVDKPMIETFIKKLQERPTLSADDKYQLSQAMLLNMNFDAIDRWGAAKHGGGLDQKVSVWEMTNSTFADLAPYYKA